MNKILGLREVLELLLEEGVKPENLVEEYIKRNPEAKEFKEEIIKIASEITNQDIELNQKTSQFLEDPYLLLRIKNQFDKLIVGETENKILIYFIGLSSKTDFPLSLILTGESSAGKNWLIRNILDPYLANQTLLITRGTAASLDRIGKSNISLDGKILYAVEYKGITALLESIKLGISERRLKLLTTFKDNKGNISVEIVDTPARYSFIATKADINIPSDMLNRTLISSCDLTEEQTLKILKYYSKKATLGDDIQLFNRKELTEEEKVISNIPNVLNFKYKIAIPFAKILPEYFPKQLRVRRDWNKLIWLIRVSTLLHQKVRIRDGLIIKVNGEERLVPNLDDILIFLVATRKALTETFLNLPSYEQDFYKVFQDAIKEKEENIRAKQGKQFVEPQGLTVKELAQITGKAQGTVYRYMEDLVNAGKAIKDTVGKQNVYYLTEAGLTGYSFDEVANKILSLTKEELKTYIEEEIKGRECEYDLDTLLNGIKKSYYLELLKSVEMRKEKKDVLITHNTKENLGLRVFKIFDNVSDYLSNLNKYKED